MQYLVTFLEGFISFISPCMLPMLPLYVMYFAGNAHPDAEGKTPDPAHGKRNVLFRSLAFVIGFTLVFTLLGLFAGALGGFLTRYKTAVNIVCGLIVIIFGLGYLGVFRLPFNGMMKDTGEINSVLSAFLFGVVYSVSFTPCVGAFLGSALMLASSSGGGALTGAMLLLCYSLGLGIPFVISALLIDRLTSAFGFIKRHYRTVNLVCGIFLIVVGITMAAGLFDRLLPLLK